MFKKSSLVLGLVGLSLATWLFLSGLPVAMAGGGGRGGGGGGGRGFEGRGGYGGYYRGGGVFIGVGYGGYWGWGYPYSGYGYDWPGYYGAADYPVPYGSAAPPSPGVPAPGYYGSSDAPQAAPAPPPSPVDGARVLIRVPADAQVLIEKQPTQQTGPVRQFESPALEPGREYTYEITARWHEGAQEMSQTKKILVHARDIVNVDFTAPAGN